MPPKLVLKIESQKGIEFAKKTPKKVLKKFQLMAARDDLFLGYANKRSEFLDSLEMIAEKDPNAILASKIMSGLSEYPNELTIGDMADMALMKQFGYKHFMFQDELADCFAMAIRNWQEIIWKKK